MTTTILETKQYIKQRKAFLFDFDGTLANLDKLNVDAIKVVLKSEFNLPFTKDDFMKFMSGRGSKDGFKMFLENHNIQNYDIEKLSKLYNQTKRELIEEHLEEEIYLIPGIKEFLKYLKENQKRMVVVTSSNYDYVKKVLTHFNLFQYFEKIYDRGTVEKSKPDPEMFLQAIKYTKLDTDECIAFEDSLFGLKSSKNANLFTIGILNEGWNDEFVYDLADIVVKSYEELL
jgi:alpha,alpha-trehalose phosphorylase